ncbi:Multiple RNA-binding domain-containing protein 1 [Thelohanellus kitauei]|uniref:Multiple RNA-binding domain-containing protein 1 n=1 Tax=Thelohanellus kitauei TaxID=669202 RepID=A0A0C2M8D7_THEKT|nr:Multiple RNA-binding domain-containing protein 1 [Thelohanellus kitauei]
MLKNFEINDIKLLHKQNGTFRNFAFVGVPTSAMANEIIRSFNCKYYRTSKLEVEPALPVGVRTNKYSESNNNLREDRQPSKSGKLPKGSKPESQLLKCSNIKENPEVPDPIFEINEEDRDDFEEFLRLHNIDPEETGAVFVETNKKEIAKKVENVLTVKMAENTNSLVDSGRLFVRNLPFNVDDDEFKQFFSSVGVVSDVYLPKDTTTLLSKGFGYVTFENPSDAVRALESLDGHPFMGRVIHIIPAEARPVLKPSKNTGIYMLTLGNKKQKETDLEQSWNTLFLGARATVEIMSKKTGIPKTKLLKDDKISAAVKLAVGETDIINQTKKFLLENGVCLEAFNNVCLSNLENYRIFKRYDDCQELAC